MTLPVRSLRLQRYNTTQLDRMSYEDGEIFYDDESDTLRIMNGKFPGGRKVATQVWTTGQLTTNLANYATLTYTNSQLALKAPINNPTFTGTVNGITATMVGLGNVTNESKTTMFSSPTFTGTVNGITATMVGLGNVTNESKTTMFSNPTFTGTVSGVSQTMVGLSNVTNESKATMFASPTFTGVITSAATNATTLGTSGLATLNSLSVTTTASVTGTLGVTGTTTLAGLSATTGSFTSTLGVTGAITTPAQVSAGSAVVSNNVQANTASVTNDVTVGANVNISTLPTEIQHATNKKYVDSRALAFSIALS